MDGDLCCAAFEESENLLLRDFCTNTVETVLDGADVYEYDVDTMMCTVTQTLVTEYFTMDSVSVGTSDRMVTQASDRNSCCIASDGFKSDLRRACTFRRDF